MQAVCPCAPVQVPPDTMAEARTEGYVSILVANLGYRNTTEG